jgi:PHD/YefM family antitoxin component YafN of YafNO toxin-antitoxin module
MANQQQKGESLRTFRSAGVPYIDPSVEHVGVSKLRTLNATNLSNFNKTLVIQDNDTPLAVLLKYEQFLIMQNKLQAALDTIEMLSNKEAASGVLKGVKDLSEGRGRALSEIDPDLKIG